MTYFHKRKKIPIIFELGATTWRVLISLLTLREPIGPRELSRFLKMSSPSVALYHLEKLNSHNLIEKTSHGEYQVRKEADLSFLDNFLFLRHRVVPRITVYASFITGLVLVYLSLVAPDYGLHNIFALIIGVSASVFLWAEVHRMWKGFV